MDDQQPTPEALQAARRHIAAAEAHERKVAVHEQSAEWLEARGETDNAARARHEADLERDAARDEWDRAEAIQGPTQMTRPKGRDKRGRRHKPVEIPIPTREAFLRDLGRVAPPVDSP